MLGSLYGSVDQTLTAKAKAKAKVKAKAKAKAKGKGKGKGKEAKAKPTPNPQLVIPASAGIQRLRDSEAQGPWIPAYAGMTAEGQAAETESNANANANAKPQTANATSNARRHAYAQTPILASRHPITTPAQGAVNRSNCSSIANADARDPPHMSIDGRNDPHTAGRSG